MLQSHPKGDQTDETYPCFAAVAAFTVLGVYLHNKFTPSIKNVSKAVGKLTNEVYELNKSNTAIDNAISKWDEYDNKIDIRPKYLTIGATTLYGLGYIITKELIIREQHIGLK